MSDYSGLYRGSVADVQDPENRGRVRLRVPAVLGNALSAWAEPTYPVSDAFIHDINDRVWVNFEGGDLNRPTFHARMEVSEVNLDAPLRDRIANIADQLEGLVQGLGIIGADNTAYYQDEPPSDAIERDVWYDTNDGLRMRIHNGTEFVDPESLFLIADIKSPENAGPDGAGGYNPGVVIGPAGVLLYDEAGPTVFLSSADGLATFRGDIASGTHISAPVLTGGTWETEATPERGLKFNSAGMVGYDTEGNPTLVYISETGSVAMTGTLTSGSQIRGASISTDAEGNGGQGIEFDDTGMTVYGEGGEATLSIDAATGSVEMTGELRQAVLRDIRSITLGTGEEQITISPETGIRIGPSAYFPADGTTPTITANLTTESATMRGVSNIQDQANLGGTFSANNGITSPTRSPTVENVLPETPLTGSPVASPVTYGLTTVGTEWATAYAYSNRYVNILRYDKTTGALTGNQQVLTNTGAAFQFIPTGGVVYLDGFYYLLGYTYGSSTTAYKIAKVDPATMRHTQVFTIPTTGGKYVYSRSGATLGTDGTNLLMGWVGYSNLADEQYYFNITTFSTAFATVSDVVLEGDATTTASQTLSGVYVGSGDFGSKRHILVTQSDNVMVWNDTNKVDNQGATVKTRVTSEDWGSAPTLVRALNWDGSKFRVLGWNMRIYTFNNNLSNQTIYARYTWYDGNPAGGGTHETAASPAGGPFTWSKRFQFNVIAEPGPDVDKVPAGDTDANIVRFYIGTSATNPTLFYTSPVGGYIYSHTAGSLTPMGAGPLTVGEPYPTVISPGWDTSLGQLESGKVKTLGAETLPAWYLRGDGSHHGILPVGMISPFAGDSTVDPPEGWLWCKGGTYNQADFPRLFAVIGTVYGAGGAGTFKVPDLRNRFPIGADDNALGATGGSTDASLPSHSHSVPSHSHGHSLSVGAVGMTTVGNTETTGTGGRITQVDGSATQHGHPLLGSVSSSSAGTTGSGGGGSVDITPPFLAVNYMIRAV